MDYDLYLLYCIKDIRIIIYGSPNASYLMLCCMDDELLIYVKHELCYVVLRVIMAASCCQDLVPGEVQVAWLQPSSSGDKFPRSK